MAIYQASSGTPSSTFINYASGLLENPFQDYFFCRITNNNNSDYVLILEPELGSGSVTGSSYYYFVSGVNSGWSFHDENITVQNVTGKFCYSSEDGYPSFVESNFPVNLAILAVLCINVLWGFLRQFMLALMNKIHKGGYKIEKDS